MFHISGSQFPLRRVHFSTQGLPTGSFTCWIDLATEGIEERICWFTLQFADQFSHVAIQNAQFIHNVTNQKLHVNSKMISAGFMHEF